MTVLCVGFTSCSDDDDEEKKEEHLIVGKWKALDSGYEGNFLEFKSNGEFSYVYPEGDSENGKYKIESNELYMIWLEDEEPEWYRYKLHTLNSTNLVIERYDEKGDLDGEKDNYQRMN